MATFSSSQSEVPEQKLGNKLIKSTLDPQSSLSNGLASTIHEKYSVGRLKDRIMNDAVPRPNVSYDGKSDTTSNNANLKVIWDDIMKDFGLTGKPHRDTAVLMISWDKKFDDLHTKAKVDGLSDSGNGPSTPNLQIIAGLLEFVLQFNNDSALLIVYYAGHGIPGKPGELHLAGNRQPDKELSSSNSVAWHDAVHILKNAKPDILLIFDCCYAGNLLPCDINPHYPTRSFECIAACGRDKETNRPGEKSFTAALIWSLQRLVKEERTSFTTQELQAMIMKAPNFPENQFVPLLQHNEPRDQRLVLAPTSRDLNTLSPELTTSIRTGSELPHHYLDLRFWYLNPLDEKKIEEIASQLRKLMKEKSIGASRIGWLGLKKRDGQASSRTTEK